MADICQSGQQRHWLERNFSEEIRNWSKESLRQHHWEADAQIRKFCPRSNWQFIWKSDVLNFYQLETHFKEADYVELLESVGLEPSAMIMKSNVKSQANVQ